MDYIPDPIEIMHSNIERLIDEYIEGCCMECRKDVGEDGLTCISPIGDGPLICFDCLPNHWKEYFKNI
jgi:hypothetical protein